MITASSNQLFQLTNIFPAKSEPYIKSTPAVCDTCYPRSDTSVMLPLSD